MYFRKNNYVCHVTGDNMGELMTRDVEIAVNMVACDGAINITKMDFATEHGTFTITKELVIRREIAEYKLFMLYEKLENLHKCCDTGYLPDYDDMKENLFAHIGTRMTYEQCKAAMSK